MALIGLIGCGRWGQNLLQELVQAGAEVYVADPSETARDLAKAANANEVCDAVDKLPRVDGYLIATPVRTHYQIATSLLDKDVPIFIEKPVSLDLNETEQLLGSNNRRIFELHAWRYHAAVRKMARALDEKLLGKARWIRTTRANWTSPGNEGDAIWTLLPHDLSIILELLGELPSLRSAIAETCARKPVGVTACLEAPSGVKCLAEVSTRYSSRRREVRVHCDNGVMELSPDASTLSFVRGKPDQLVYEVEEFKVGHLSTLEVQMKAIVDYLQGGQEPKSNAAESLAIARLIHEIRQSTGVAAKTNP